MTFSIKIDKTLRSNVKSLKYTAGAYSLSKHKTAGGALLFLVILWVPPIPPVANPLHYDQNLDVGSDWTCSRKHTF